MSVSKTPHRKRPVSDRQLAANRANAAHSTGPRTPEGKARSSQSASRHGFAAANYALADGLRRMVREGNTWSLFLRYQAQAERRGAPRARRAVEEFERLKALPSDLPIEPIFDAQPDENTTPSPPSGTNPFEPGIGFPPGAEASAPESGIDAQPGRVEGAGACDVAPVLNGTLEPGQLAEGKPSASISSCPAAVGHVPRSGERSARQRQIREADMIPVIGG